MTLSNPNQSHVFPAFGAGYMQLLLGFECRCTRLFEWNNYVCERNVMLWFKTGE